MSNKRNVDQFLISLNNLSKSLEVKHFNFEIDLFNESFKEITKINENIGHIKTLEEKEQTILNTNLLVASTFRSFVNQFKEIIAKDKPNLQKVMNVVKGKEVLERSEYYNQGRKSFERVRFLLKQLSFLEITRNFIVDIISSYSPKPIDKNVSIEKQKELRSMIYLLFSVSNELTKFNENNFKLIGRHIDFTVICDKEVLRKYIKEKRLITNEFIVNETIINKLEKESIKEEVYNLSRIDGHGFLGSSFDFIIDAFEKEINDTLPEGFSFSFNKQNNKEEYSAELKQSHFINGKLVIELTRFNNFKQTKTSFTLQQVDKYKFKYYGKGEGSSLFGLKPFDIEITISTNQDKCKLFGISFPCFSKRITNTIFINSSSLSVTTKCIQFDNVTFLDESNSNINSFVWEQHEVCVQLIVFKYLLSFEINGDDLIYTLTMLSKFEGRDMILALEDSSMNQRLLNFTLTNGCTYVYQGVELFYVQENVCIHNIKIKVKLLDKIDIDSKITCT
ncbi:hypothetical protein EHI8A_078140 [Entamoeba histolytica HM-1:IMSS-B]|uniref:Uncharacterized protein n=6 Tax=Entamoeba histolytica TaxID=5759 RepID=C4LVL6_ENTH1|nr:hypothetical protein EHI_103740 [Entamoeba histolytica HM-1:IMSS]EMD45966.1 Hypothetical protein EHI5A_086040 [Entamoeba histolytica KU27]EMH76746.1 hypothetical protein EHI8A_078140 [Entamoeba histolytica HM-1:IMSS-B]EMS15984.1 hypothetical protein KM1_125820 [Entamoeba histolytica HM-3:IMSS]ENY65777.1 hypothetical protein EHI7A_065640 [Entamoeba histolytica HM-1:IMSS-A]GAT92715.1 hypothetical protein CL6EHI_103740 [Entamoeba histolytica]|eukprot:XP_653364.1 hypothetical protein EHI_103740 [Entamoeba histolytica HM-1:IMSS]